MKIRLSPRGHALDLYRNIEVSQGGSLRICMEIRAFPRVYLMGLYRNAHILQGRTLSISMQIRVFPLGVSFGFAWKYVYFTRGYLQDLHQHLCIPRGYPWDLYGITHILQRGTLRICMNINVFPRGRSFYLCANLANIHGIKHRAQARHNRKTAFVQGFCFKWFRQLGRPRMFPMTPNAKIRTPNAKSGDCPQRQNLLTSQTTFGFRKCIKNIQFFIY